MSNDHESAEQKADKFAAAAAALEADLSAEADSARQKTLTAKIRLQRGLEEFHRERFARAQIVMDSNRKDFRYPRTQNVKLID